MKYSGMILTVLVLCITFTVTKAQQTQPNKIQQLQKAQQAELQYQKEQEQVDSLIKVQNLEKRFFSEGRLYELVRVQRNRPLYYVTHNVDAQASIAVDKIQPGGISGFDLTGKGITLGEWDGGRVRVTHQEYEGRVTQIDDPDELSGHATHVAGTMIAAGVNPDAEGMSPEAEIKAHNWNNDFSEMRSAAANGLVASNHSYGTVDGWGGNRACRDDTDEEFPVWHGDPTISLEEDYRFGFYVNGAERWDDIAYDNPHYLIVQSAGNDRGESGPPASDPGHCVYRFGEWQYSERIRQADGGENGYESIGSKGNAKNILTVGAVRDIDNGYQNPSDVQVTGFSSFGPTDDGRIKPDVVGNGLGLISSCSASDDCYSSSSGTSMSSPNVTGAIGLLHEWFRRLNQDSTFYAATVKALLIQTADEAGPYKGPDFKHGWGLVNAHRAAELIKKDNLHGGDVIQQLSLNEGDTIEVPLEIAPDSKELNVTLAWTDPPGNSPEPQLDPTDPMLINNVDLKVVGPDSTHYPWKLDGSNPSAAATKGKNDVDNVEKVTVSDPAGGDYLVQITHDGSLQSGSQDISLVLDRGPGETYQASGRVSIEGAGDGAAGVPLYISGFGETDTVRTDSLGHFVFYGLYNAEYTVRPAEREVEGVTFSPDSINFSVDQQDISEVNFIASTPGKRNISMSLNTATLPDTIGPADTIQVRGNFAGTSDAPDQLPDGNTLAWNEQSTLNMTHIAGDYWETEFEIPESQTIRYKFYSSQNEEIEAGGLETGEAHTIEDGVGHLDLPLHYYEQDQESDYAYDWLPWDDQSGMTAVRFRIYIPEIFNPIIVGVRGNGFKGRGPLREDQTRVRANRESQSDGVPGYRLFSGVAYYDTSLVGQVQQYKFNFELTDWIEAPWRSFVIPGNDTTLHWTYPNNVLPVVDEMSVTVEQDTFAVVNVLDNASDPDGDSLRIGGFDPPMHGTASVVGDSLLKYDPDSGYTGKDEVVYYIEDSRNARVESRLKVEVQQATSIEDKPQVPTEYALHPNYPNPFNPSTTIKYALPAQSHVKLHVYNYLGRRVATLVNESQSAGIYTIRWNAGGLNSGVYYYRIESGEYRETRSMILVK